MKTYKFILSGGGTGGHIYPAIAIANELKLRFPSAEILFVGAKDKMEMQKVPQAGYKIEGFWIFGLQRKLTFKNLLFPIKLICSLWKARKILKRFKPDLVIGTGGFASGPLLQIAEMMNIPTVIQEQNSYPGITNKMLAKKASLVCVAYENLESFFSKEKIRLTGNPVRQDIINLDDKKNEAKTFYKLNPHKKTLLVIEGSLGSRRINQLMEKELNFILSMNIQIIWQCGKLYYDEYKKHENSEVLVQPFIERMDFAYASADIIISRAGASSVSELCLVGKPVIFIPSPNVAADHQRKNALSIVEKNAAIMIEENKLDSCFEDSFKSLIEDIDCQKKYATNIKNLSKPQASREIVDEIEKLIKLKT